MSHSPERISSYRRHFEGSSSSSFSQQVRVSSPSPSRREGRAVSIGYACRPRAVSMRVESVGGRNVSAARRSRMLGAGVSAGAMVCVGPSGEPAMDLDAAAVENQEFLSTRKSERQEMIALNDRLAVYIEKVRSLEQQNQLLEAEIEAYKNRFERPSGLRLLYEEQLRELKKLAEQMRIQRDASVASKEFTAAQLGAIKLKYEEALELRKKAEFEIEAFRPDVDKATASRITLEKKLEQLEAELEFLKRVHQEEIEELMRQIYAAQVAAESAFALPDLAAAMKQIQTQYDDIAAKNLQEMDSWYKNKFEDITKKTSKHVDRVRGFREEIAGAKKDIQSKERDLDEMRTRNEALEAQIRNMQEKNHKELEDLQARIEALQLELKTTKEKIALHLREYQDLLNMKMSLEIEITTYRKLIEGEDLRLAGMVQTLSVATCSATAIGAGVSFSGGSARGAGGVGGALRGSSGVRGAGSGGGMGGGIGAGSDSAAGGVGGRMSTGGGAGGADVVDGPGSGAGGVGASGGGINGTSGGAHSRGVGAGGVGVGGSGGGAGASGVGAGNGGGSARMGAGGMGAGGADSGLEGHGTGPGGESLGAGGVGSEVGGGGGGSGGMGGGEGSGDGTSGGSGGGVGSAGAGDGIGGSGGTEDAGGDGSGTGGKAGVGGGVGDTSGPGIGYGSDGYDGNIEGYADQAVELTERRTVLIRTVKKEGDVMEMDHQEQTYTISGAADESDQE